MTKNFQSSISSSVSQNDILVNVLQYYLKKKADPTIGKLTTSEHRIMTMKAFERTWNEMLEEPNVIIRSF